MATDDSAEPRGRRSKVERLLEEYDLEGLGDELERYWTAEDPDERRSLRDLATLFNRRLLEAALVDAGADVLEGEVANTYRLLTDDEVSARDRTRIRRRLEREGIDVDELTSDFVSYQAIRTYLKEYRDAEHSKSAESPRQKAIETVQRLRSRLVTIAEQRLESLRSAGELTLGEFRLIVTLRVICEDCGTQTDLTTLIEERGCDCEP
ncbi:MAG: rod-determining factor RdfA [Haloglomus sp.]